MAAARSSHEEQRRRRRKRLVRGLLLGGAAVGLPALANVLIARRTRRLEAPSWGRGRRYAWKLGEIAFRTAGEGPPLLLLHSFGPGQDGVQWRAAAERLARTHRVYVPDLLGWGLSDKPRVAYDSELYIQLVGDFLQDVVAERCVLGAAGLPAAYAVQVAADLPEAVRALALVVPSGIELHGDEPDLKDALVHRLLRLPVLGTSALNLLTSRTALQQGLKRDLARPSQAATRRIDRLYRSSHQVGSHAPLAAYFSGYLNHRVDRALGRLTTPLWLAWGRNAGAPPLETADLWLQQAPQAELEVFDGCANLPHVERPKSFTGHLERFLSSLDE